MLLHLLQKARKRLFQFLVPWFPIKRNLTPAEFKVVPTCCSRIQGVVLTAHLERITNP